jgi:hypothetical protein
MSRGRGLVTQVVGSKLCSDASGEYVAFQVQVAFRERSWLLLKRYRQFAQLNSDLAKLDALRGSERRCCVIVACVDSAFLCCLCREGIAFGV